MIPLENVSSADFFAHSKSWSFGKKTSFWKILRCKTYFRALQNIWEMNKFSSSLECKSFSTSFSIFLYFYVSVVCLLNLPFNHHQRHHIRTPSCLSFVHRIYFSFHPIPAPSQPPHNFPHCRKICLTDWFEHFFFDWKN